MRISIKELGERAERAGELMDPCRVCPRRCGAHRRDGKKGDCRVDGGVPIVSHGPHFGEERPISGFRGSGTVFFGGCNLHCIFCQNADISQVGPWRERGPEALASAMLDLQERGCHNINLVSPSHVVPQILDGLLKARREGFSLPIVYNSGGYDLVETLRLLEGVVDIYMPDAKYWDPEVGERLSAVPDYPERMRAALVEMHRQVGDLVVDRQGVAVSGLLVRHLVMPERLAGTEQLCDFIGKRISEHTYINIMAQYRPCFRAHRESAITRRPTAEELRHAYDAARKAGLHRFDAPLLDA